MKVHELDATNQSLGRMASTIATMLRAKDTPHWTPNIIPDVQVVVTHLDQIVFKGSKADTKVYFKHSLYPGGMRERTLKQLWAKDKKEVLRMAVRGMLPENRQRDTLLNHLIVK